MARTKALKNRSSLQGSLMTNHQKNPNQKMIQQEHPGVIARLMGLDQIPSIQESQIFPTRIIVLKPGPGRNLDLKANAKEMDFDSGASKEMAKEIVQMMRKTLGGHEIPMPIKAFRRKEGSKESSVIREAKKRLFERCSAVAAGREEHSRSLRTLAEILCSSEGGLRREKVRVRDKVSKLLSWKTRTARSQLETLDKSSSPTPLISFGKGVPPSPEHSGEEQDHSSPISILEAPFNDSPPLSEFSHLISRSPQISSISRIESIDREEDLLPVNSLLISSSWYSMDPWKEMLQEEEGEMKREIEREVLRELVLEIVADVTDSWGCRRCRDV